MTFPGVQVPVVALEPAKTQLLVLQSEFCEQGPVARGFWQDPLVGAPAAGYPSRGPLDPSQMSLTFSEMHSSVLPQAAPT